MNSNKRRLKMIHIPMEIMQYVITGKGVPLVDLGLPEDTKITSTAYSYERNCFMVTASHKSFDKVAEGSIIPVYKSEISEVCDILKIESWEQLEEHLLKQHDPGGLVKMKLIRSWPKWPKGKTLRVLKRLGSS